MLKNLAYIIGRRLLKTHPPRWIIFVIELAIFLLSLFFAFYIRLNFNIQALLSYPFEYIIPVVLIIRISVYLAFKLYSGLIRYSTVKDLERVIIVNVIGSAVIIIMSISYRFLNVENQNLIPIGVLIMEFLLTTLLMISTRLLIKIIYFELNNRKSEVSNVVIYGVGDLANLTLQAVEGNGEFNARVVAFISSDSESEKCIGNTLAGVKIFSENDLESLSRTKKISKLIIAKKKIDVTDRQRLIEKCSDLHIKVLTIPIAENWIDGTIHANQIRELKIEDLLERPVINLDETAVRNEISGRVVLITGAAGSIGSELVRQICGFAPKLMILYDQAETPLHSLMLELKEGFSFCNFEIVLGDITNEHRLDYVFRNYKPEFVFHAAAYKHVPMLEDNPKEAMRTNVYGTKMLADYSRKFAVYKFVMISTDKAVNPTNVMGASKRISEMYIQSLSGENNHNTHFITTRFGNVLGSNGSVVGRFQQQIEKGEALTVTHPDIQRYFMTIPEAVQLVLEASVMGKGGEIFVFDMGKMVKIKDLAEKMIRLSGLIPDEDIEIKYTGLRPGERMYEELLNETENLLPTYHPKILKAKVNQVSHSFLEIKFADLYPRLHLIDKEEVVRIMKDIVPEFKSRNSVYELLDKKTESQES